MNDPQPEGHMASHIERRKFLATPRRRCNRVAARGTRAAAGSDSAHRCADGIRRKRSGSASLDQSSHGGDNMAVKWSNWASLGKPEKAGIGRPFVQHNQDGRLEVFAVGGGEIFNIWQVFPNAGWTDGWQSLASPRSELSAQGGGFDADLDSHVVGRNADGRLEIFAGGGN